jgi:hypothetical protein
MDQDKATTPRSGHLKIVLSASTPWEELILAIRARFTESEADLSECRSVTVEYQGGTWSLSNIATQIFELFPSVKFQDIEWVDFPPGMLSMQSIESLRRFEPAVVPPQTGPRL